MIKEAIGVGETVSLAQQDACQKMGKLLGDVHFEVLQMPVKKTFGLFGGKLAKVRAYVEVLPAKVAANYLRDLLEAYGVINFEIEIEDIEGGANLHVTGENAKIAIGRRGDILDSMQYLAGLVANDVSDEYFRLTINIEDYRERRKKALEDLGKKLAYRVLKTGEAITLEPMTPYERKVLHLSIEEVKGVKSWSEGEDLNRHLIVDLDDKANSKDMLSKKNKGNFKKETGTYKNNL